MPRPLRPDPPGGWHHVINRGADRQDIFSCDADFAYFEQLLADAVDAHDIEIHAYALMSNHYHLLMHCPDGGLSAAMKDIQSVYVGTYNHHHDRTGPMYEGRFTAYSADSPAARHLTGRYVHRNPLDIVEPAALAAYRWSSFRHYATAAPTPQWLTTGELAAQFADSAAYADYVITAQPSDDQAERYGTSAGLGRLADLDVLISSVCDVPPTRLHERARNNSERLLAITLAVELRLMDSAGIAAHYGMGDAASARSLARRGRVRLVDDAEFAARREAALAARFRSGTKGA